MMARGDTPSDFSILAIIILTIILVPLYWHYVVVPEQNDRATHPEKYKPYISPEERCESSGGIPTYRFWYGFSDCVYLKEK